ncbi:MAG: DUF3276 family protein [Candidatus Shikimatogenerans bostrichidophilus]|nr:MAG: DUF3276 family protein [Candidatus Shikimatogenerans bostrichidophilus]
MNYEDKETKINNYTNNYLNFKRKKKEIFSKTLIARSRRYFFDTNETNAGDYFLSITESKKLFLNDGRSIFKKHKIFIYKEDFENFQKILSEVIKFIYDKKGKVSIYKTIEKDKFNKFLSNKEDTLYESNKKELDKVIDEANKKELKNIIDNKEVKKYTKEEIKDGKEVKKNTKEKIKDNKEVKKNTKEKIKDNKEVKKNTKEKIKDSKEVKKNTKEKIKDSKEVKKNTKEKKLSKKK